MWIRNSHVLGKKGERGHLLNLGQVSRHVAALTVRYNEIGSIPKPKTRDTTTETMT